MNSEQNQPVDFTTLSTILDAVETSVEVPEAHGILCGLLSEPGQEVFGKWLEQVLWEPDPNNTLVKQAVGVMQDLYRHTQVSLDDEGLSFEPLLPDNDESLFDRAEALASWCEGYIAGLGLSGWSPSRSLSGDAEEAVRDLAEISRMDSPEKEDEEQERDLMELTEYVRVAVLLVRDELQSMTNTPPAGEPLH